jgi:hypothetical protein
MLQDRPNAGGRQCDAYGDEFPVDPPIAPSRIGQPDHERTGAGGDRWSARTGVRIGPAFGDEISVPPQQRRWLDEQVALAACKESLEAAEQRPVGLLEHWVANLTSENCYLVAQHHDLSRQVHVLAKGEPDQLDDAAERSV